MSRAGKLKAKIAQNPKHVRFADLDKLLRVCGFVVRQPGRGSSHHTYTKGNKRITVPFRRPFVREHYVKEVLKLLEGECDDEESGILP